MSINPYFRNYGITESGPQLRLFGCRIHHGLVGCLLCVVGVALAFHDRRDWPWSIREAGHLKDDGERVQRSDAAVPPPRYGGETGRCRECGAPVGAHHLRSCSRANEDDGERGR